MANGQLNIRTVKLGDNADITKNFLITVPAVADGSLTIERENGIDVLTVDTTGKVAFPGNVVPAVIARRTTTLSVPTGLVTSTLITAYNIVDISDAAFNATTGRFQPSVAGLYQVNISVGYDGNGIGTATVAIAAVLKNGVVYRSAGVGGNGTGSGFPRPLMACLVYMNGSTDYMEAGTTHNASTSIVVGGGDFSAVLVRAG